MTDRFDKLGRRIPQFDRSAAGAKGAQTQKEKHGNDFHARHGAAGGRKRTRGYFGTLKDSGDTATIIANAKKGAAVTNSRSVEERHESALKGWETKRATSGRRHTARRSGKPSVRHDAKKGD